MTLPLETQHKFLIFTLVCLLFCHILEPITVADGNLYPDGQAWVIFDPIAEGGARQRRTTGTEKGRNWFPKNVLTDQKEKLIKLPQAFFQTSG